MPWTAKRAVAPGLLSRLGEKVVFHRLPRPEIEKIASPDLGGHGAASRASRRPIERDHGERVCSRLLDKGTDPDHGVRLPIRVLEQRLIFPLAQLVASGKLEDGETVEVDRADDLVCLSRRRADERRRPGTAQ